MSNREVSRSRKGVVAGGGGAVPALTTELGVVFLLRDLRPSRTLCLPLVAPGRGGMVTVHCKGERYVVVVGEDVVAVPADRLGGSLSTSVASFPVTHTSKTSHSDPGTDNQQH